MIGNIKYSIILPYYKRMMQLEKTFCSFSTFYSLRNDFEVVLIVDPKTNEKEQNILNNICLGFSKIFCIRIITADYGGVNISNPCVAFNIGANEAKGDYFIISNPECLHTVDILKGLDNEFENNSDVYVVCGCMSLGKDDSFHMWYQHSKHRNKGYHFCSALSKKTYFDVGGFDERFKNGISYDDDAFRDTLIKNGIEFVYRDDLLTHHQFHEKVRLGNPRKLLQVNKQIYNKFYGVF